MPLYAATIFLSAFLLFLVQPIIAKQILPWFGGSASVWATCLVFFQTVLLVAQGRPMKLACGTTGLSRQSVCNALRRYRRRRRPTDLADRPRSGRPRVARPIGNRQILAALRVDPRDAGFNATAWTVPLLARLAMDRQVPVP